MPYPESFSGATMQFFGYYRQGGIGLYCAALDGEASQKWLNFYKENSALRASQVYGYEDCGYGKGLEQAWDFVVTPLEDARWETCADRYKTWAHAQVRCVSIPMTYM
jgi:hypothetical protein